MIQRESIQIYLTSSYTYLELCSLLEEWRNIARCNGRRSITLPVLLYTYVTPYSGLIIFCQYPDSFCVGFDRLFPAARTGIAPEWEY